MDEQERLTELYEATGDEDAFAQARRLYEQAFAGAGGDDADVLQGYGHLLYCHGQYALRQAVG